MIAMSSVEFTEEFMTELVRCWETMVSPIYKAVFLSCFWTIVLSMIVVLFAKFIMNTN